MGHELRLARTRRWLRLDTWQTLLMVYLLGAGTYWLVTTFVSSSSVWTRALILFGGSTVFLLFAGFTRAELLELLGPSGRLELDQPELIVHSPKWFSHPLHVPIEQIRFATIDDSNNKKRRFPLVGAQQTAREDRDRWLWRRNRQAALPALDLNALDETPNVAIVFDPPLEVPGRKTIKNFIFHIGSFVDRRLLVMTAKVDDLKAAAARFKELDLLRQPTAADLVELELSPDEKRQQRHGNLRAWIALIVFFLVSIGIPVLWVVLRE